MNHDPLCPFFNDQTGRELVRQTGNPCVYCDLIARVRFDANIKISKHMQKIAKDHEDEGWLLLWATEQWMQGNAPDVNEFAEGLDKFNILTRIWQ